MQNQEKFKDMIILIYEKYDKSFSVAMIEAVWQELKPYDDAECLEALNHVFCYGRFYSCWIPDLLARLEEEGNSIISDYEQEING